MLADIDKAWAEVDKILEDAIGSKNAKTLAALTLQLRDALGGKVAGKRWHKKRVMEKTE